MLKHFNYVGILLLLSGSPTVTSIAGDLSESRNSSMYVAQQKNICKGFVVDTAGEPLIGANVKIKGTSKGTITDMNGAFSFSGVANGDILEFSYMGYKTTEVRYKGKIINVELEEDAEVTDEVVVVGFGTQKKVNLTGAVAQVDSKVMDTRPVLNALQALQGQIAGLNIGQSNGALNSDMSINIRGTGSLNKSSNNSPLVLIDGVEGDINSLNPNDIESVSVLKDASAASIYGSRAAMGVILVTTKSGETGKINVNYSANVRITSPTKMFEQANSLDWANYFNEACANSGAIPMFSDETIEKIKTFMNGGYTDPSKPEYYGTEVNPNNNKWMKYENAFANTDNFKEFYKAHSVSQEHNLSITGGTSKLNYRLGLGYMQQSGLVKISDDKLRRYTISLKLSSQLTKWAKLTYDFKWFRKDFEQPLAMGHNYADKIMRSWPTNPMRDPNGNYLLTMLGAYGTGGRNGNQGNSITNHMNLVLEPVKGWKINFQGSMRNTFGNSWSYTLPVYEYDCDNNPVLVGQNGGKPGFTSAFSSFSSSDRFTLNVFTSYEKKLKQHYFKAMVGVNANLNNSKDMNGSGEELISISVPELSVTQQNKKVTNNKSQLAYAGYFGRINYTFKDRYLVEGNLRYDGSSRYLGNKRWAWFPSFSVGWNIAKEGFFKPLAKTVNMFKIRGSWGSLGNNGTGSAYPFYQTMHTGTINSQWLIDGEKQNTASMPGIVSDKLTWETVRNWNVGVDIALFRNRFNLSFDYYNRSTYDMVGPAPALPIVLGTGTPPMNNANLRTTGSELELSWKDRIQNFSYGFKLVISDSKTKVTKYLNPTGNLGTYREGQILNDELWGYQTAGIAQSDEEMQEHLKNNKPNWGKAWQAGDMKFVDQNGDGIISAGAGTIYDHGDKVVLGSGRCRFPFGFTFHTGWKGFEFSAFFNGHIKQNKFLGGAYFWGMAKGKYKSTCNTIHLDYWRPDNPDAFYPRIYLNDNKNQQNQPLNMVNTGHIRLKNIRLSYSFPKSWISKVSLSGVRVYVSADNLFVISNLPDGYDPKNFTGYPLHKTVAIGMNVKF